MRFTAAIVAGLILSVSNAAALAPRSSLVVHEKRTAPPTKWIKRDRVDPGAVLPVRIGLSQNNLEKGHDYLMDV